MREQCCKGETEGVGVSERVCCKEEIRWVESLANWNRSDEGGDSSNKILSEVSMNGTRTAKTYFVGELHNLSITRFALPNGDNLSKLFSLDIW